MYRTWPTDQTWQRYLYLANLFIYYRTFLLFWLYTHHKCKHMCRLYIQGFQQFYWATSHCTPFNCFILICLIYSRGIIKSESLVGVGGAIAHHASFCVFVEDQQLVESAGRRVQGCFPLLSDIHIMWV